jgi:hypothetical protein
MLWVDVLNRSLAWADRGQADTDLVSLAVECEPGCLVPGSPGMGDEAWRRLHADVRTLRGLHAAAAVGRPWSAEERAGVSQWLAAVTLRLATAEVLAGLRLPPLRGRRQGSPLPEALEETLTTALVELLGGAGAARAAARCHGLVRPGTGPSPYDLADDEAFAAAARVTAFVASGWRQCARLVVGPRQGRYCSKACSNAAFAARKGVADPRYFARKQAEYRKRRERLSAPARSAGAFAFVD